VAPWRPAIAWVWVASLLVLIGAGLAHGPASGLRGALAVFLAWAITRELAPRRALAAAAAPVAAVAFAIPGDTDLLACFGVLLVARIAARSVGDPPTWLDLAALLGLSWWLALRAEGLPVALVLAAIIAADSPPRRARIAGVAALLVVLLTGALEGTLTARPRWDDPSMASQALLLVAAAASIWLVLAPLPARLRVRDDRKRGGLRGPRLRSARVAVLACVLATIAWTGTDGAFALSCACAALLVSGLLSARARPEVAS